MDEQVAESLELEEEEGVPAALRDLAALKWDRLPPFFVPCIV